MNYERKVLEAGNDTDKPRKGDTVRLEYTGYLFDESKRADNNKGYQFDTSKARGDGVFETPIGIGKVIRGWDVAVLEMSLGERSILTVSSDWAYGTMGFPGFIPPDSDLVFDVTLLSIDRKGGIALSTGGPSAIGGLDQPS